jgi:hypothetical protein
MRTSLLFGTAVVTLGCADSNPMESRDTSSSAIEAGTDQHYSFPCLAAPTVTGAPAWVSIYTEVLCNSGCVAGYCHGSRGRWGDLDLAQLDGAYYQLVGQPTGKLIPVDNRPTCAESTLLRVKPGAPEESLLFLKISGRAPCGTNMPPPSSGHHALAPEKVEQIRRWIELGARSFLDE